MSRKEPQKKPEGLIKPPPPPPPPPKCGRYDNYLKISSSLEIFTITNNEIKIF